MKIRICFLIIICICGKLNAQAFSQEFTNNTTLLANDYAVLSTPNKNWAILSEVDVSNNFRKTISVLSTNDSGNLQITNSYETTDTNFSISSHQALSLPNGEVLIAGIYAPNNSSPSHPFFMSLDTNGNINWVKQVDIANVFGIFFLKQLSDNSILVNLKYNDGFSHQLLFKIDALGNLTDFYEYNLTSAQVKDVIVNTNFFELLLSDGNFISIDNDLQTINWQRKYNQEIGVTINKAANGDYLLATAQVAFPAHMTVSRLDASGALIWSKYIETFETTTSLEFDIVGFHFISENPNGEIIICANSEGSANGSLFVRLDGNGNYISNHKTTSFYNKTTPPTNNRFGYGGFMDFGTHNIANFVFNKLLLTSYLDCDVAYNYTITDGTQPILTPDALQLTPVSGINTANISVIKNPISIGQQSYCNNLLSVSANLVDDPTIIVYPNPASTSITLKSTATILKISMYDLSGKLLFENINNNQVDIGHFEKGVYFLKIQTERGQVSKQVIKK